MEDGSAMNRKLNVLYEDNHIIAVEKPCNIRSQGDSTGDLSMIELIKDYIKEKYHKPGGVYLGLVHRLDRPVGGVMVFARSSKAASRLCKSFNEHRIDKRYMAIVHGKMEEEKGELVDFLLKEKDGNTIVSPDGKEAILDYQVISYRKEDNCSMVSIRLKTGRHHQIRVQFASRGHYLLGDQRYGVLDNTQISLFCYYLSFEHPVTHEVMTFECPLPKNGHWTKFTV